MPIKIVGREVRLFCGFNRNTGPGFLEMSMNTVLSLGGSGPGIKRVVRPSLDQRRPTE